MVQDQIQKLSQSGLFGQAEKMFIGITGDQKYQLPNPKVQIVRHPENHEEADTLKLIRDYVEHCPPSYILYLHTKGISHRPPTALFTEDWRNMMEYFLVEEHEEALNLLADEGAVGCNLQSDTFLGHKPHFSGGMWWATSEHLKQLDHTYLDTPSRWDREFWIGSRTPEDLKSLHESNLNKPDHAGHYHQLYPRHLYAKPRR
jgi:hypothetical protein